MKPNQLNRTELLQTLTSSAMENAPFACIGENIVVIIPTYNERDTIAELIRGILSLGKCYRVIVVDDSSPDGTADIVRNMAKQIGPRAILIQRPVKEGIGPAYVEGMIAALHSDADFIATMDGDLSHDFHDLPRLRVALESADLALGSRYVDGGATIGWPRHRKVLSKAGGTYSRIALGVDISDLTGGFKMYRRNALENLDVDTLTSDGYVFQIETTYRVLQSGGKVVEIPIEFHDRVAGSSKLSRRIVFEAMVNVWKLRLDNLRQ